MERIKRGLKFQIIDSKKAFLVFWIICILVNILFHCLNSFISYNSSFGSMANINGISYINVAMSNVIAIAIFLIVYNMVMYYESLPTAVNFSLTRREFYITAVLHNILLSFSMAVVEAILLKLDKYFVRMSGRNPLHNLGLFNLQEDSIFYIIFLLCILFMIVCVIFNLLGALLYKFGYKLWFAFIALAIIISNSDILRTTYLKCIEYIFDMSNVTSFVLKTMILSMILYVVAWFFVRKVNIRAAKK